MALADEEKNFYSYIKYQPNISLPFLLKIWDIASKITILLKIVLFNPFPLTFTGTDYYLLIYKFKAVH